MRALALIFSTLSLITTNAIADGMDGAAPMRVASTSLCADSYVLSMVDPKNITALSWQAGDAVSNAPAILRTKPKAWDAPERLLALAPTHVVFGPGEGVLAQRFLDKAGIKHTRLIGGEDFAAIESNQTALAKSLGVERPPHILPLSTPNANPISVLYLSRSGGTAGPGTFVDAAITAAGGQNLITTPGWHTPELETLVPLKPDLIITSFFDSGYASTNENGLHHRVLENKLQKTPHINIPGRLWPCAGPDLYEATDLIEAAIAGLSKPKTGHGEGDE